MTGPLGLGIGWREPLAGLAYRRTDLGFVEVVAEAFPADRPIPLPLDAIRRRGVRVVPHGVRLSLGSPYPPDPARLAALAHLAERTDAPLVSEHIAFVRAGGVEAGHLLPVPRSRSMLEVLVANVSQAMARLPVPLALEPIAALVEWPESEIDEGDFVTELLERTGALLLLDVANLYANARNHGYDPVAMLDRLPLDRLAYVHVAGGSADDAAGLYHDSHAHPVPAPVLDLLDRLAARRPVPGVMLERDSHFPPTLEIDDELDAISDAARLGPRTTSVAAGPTRPGSPSTATDEDRHRVAVQQRALVSALVAGAAPPAGFDHTRFGSTATVLARKRAEDAARRQPARRSA